MSDHERETDTPQFNVADVSNHDQATSPRDGRTEPSSHDDDRRAAAADSRSDAPRISIDDLDASARAWGGQEYGEVM